MQTNKFIAKILVLYFLLSACILAGIAYFDHANKAANSAFYIKPVDDAWRANLPHDAAQATQAYLDRLSPEVVARANHYFEGGYWLQLWDFLLGLAIAWLLLRSLVSARLRDRLKRAFRWAFLADAAYGAAYVGIVWVLSLPLSIYEGYLREHQYGMSTQAFVPWMGQQLIGLALSVVFGAIVIACLYKVIRLAGERWWLWGTVLTTGLAVFAMLISPIWIDPLFNTYKPVQDVNVRSAVLTMASADGVPAKDVYQFDASQQTTRVSANVSGIFGSASVRLNDNLLKRCTLPEIRAVMGHELGHYVMNHIYKALVEMALLSLVSFLIAKWLMTRLIARLGASWGIGGVGDVASLPLLAAVFSVLTLLGTPVLNTVVRTQEIEADRFGLNLAREPNGMAEVTLKLVEYRKPDPSAFEEFVFFDHPSARSRIYDAMRWRESMGAH